MARLNIEDCWWTDPRRSALIRLLGDEDLADARAIRAWRLAQEFWKFGRGLVPRGLFETLQSYPELLSVGLAEIREDKVYIRGSSTHHEWIVEAKESGAKGGKVSAKRPRDAKGRLKKIPDQCPSDIQGSSKAGPSESKRIQGSSSSSFSLSISNTENKESIGEVAIAPTLPGIADKGLSKRAEEASRANRFVATYVSAYQTRFPGHRPEDINDGKVRGQILNWIKGYPLDRACQLIQVYFQMEAKWFDTKGYDFLTFRNNLNKVGQALDTGVDPGGTKVDFAAMVRSAT